MFDTSRMGKNLKYGWMGFITVGCLVFLAGLTLSDHYGIRHLMKTALGENGLGSHSPVEQCKESFQVQIVHQISSDTQLTENKLDLPSIGNAIAPVEVQSLLLDGKVHTIFPGFDLKPYFDFIVAESLTNDCQFTPLSGYLIKYNQEFQFNYGIPVAPIDIQMKIDQLGADQKELIALLDWCAGINPRSFQCTVPNFKEGDDTTKGYNVYQNSKVNLKITSAGRQLIGCNNLNEYANLRMLDRAIHAQCIPAHVSNQSEYQWFSTFRDWRTQFMVKERAACILNSNDQLLHIHSKLDFPINLKTITSDLDTLVLDLVLIPDDSRDIDLRSFEYKKAKSIGLWTQFLDAQDSVKQKILR